VHFVIAAKLRILIYIIRGHGLLRRGLQKALRRV
jgi:hypothetical protein